MQNRGKKDGQSENGCRFPAPKAIDKARHLCYNEDND